MKYYFYIQLVLIIIVDIMLAASIINNEFVSNLVVWADLILGLLQFFPTIILAILLGRQYPALPGYLLLSVSVILFSLLLQGSKNLQIAYFYLCFGIAHAFVYLLYRLQKTPINS